LLQSLLPRRIFFQLSVEGTWETEVGYFDVAAATMPLVETSADSDAGELMIREEDLILQPNPDALAVIKTRRFLGREYRYWGSSVKGQNEG